jgi:hypothetical protein
MSVVLACPWQPRGELSRFQRFFPRLQKIYGHFVIALSEQDESIVGALETLGIRCDFYEQWSGRHTVLRMGLETPADFIHYVDMDRLVRWIELRPDELEATVERLQKCDSLVIGRTPAAYATHAKTLIETERLPNTFFSHWFGREMDFSAGSRGFSRRAAAFILKQSTDMNSLSMDIGWAVLVKRAGYSLDYIEVDGLDWETADRFRDHAADAKAQRELAEEIDAKPDSWKWRVKIAQELTQFGLDAIRQPLEVER